MSDLYTRLLGFLALQRGEVARTLLTFVYLFLIIATYMMVRPASKSLFLSRLGAQYIPWVTIVVALFLGPISGTP